MEHARGCTCELCLAEDGWEPVAWLEELRKLLHCLSTRPIKPCNTGEKEGAIETANLAQIRECNINDIQ